MTRPLLCGFLKVRNERLRGPNNLDRVLTNLSAYCDRIVVCDDASTDGTREVLQGVIPAEDLILVPSGEQDFRKELFWKEVMLSRVRAINPHFAFWLDGDEVLDTDGTGHLRDFCEKEAGKRPAWRFPEVNLWQNPGWARTDSQFDEGAFIRLWKFHDGLSFDVKDGTHHHQFPKQILDGGLESIGMAPYSVLHYGNVGINLRWKAIQYWGGLGGVDRHLAYTSAATFRPVDLSAFPEHCKPLDLEYSRPGPIPIEDQTIIRSMQNLKRLPGWFTVVVPAYNRAHTLDRTIESVLAQDYPHWVLLLVDDGSDDGTWPLMKAWTERDPRIFAVQNRGHHGGVAANELGMEIASEWTEYWTRLGSDDTFSPQKLSRDLTKLGPHDAVFGPFQVIRGGQPAEVCRLDTIKDAFGRVEASEALKRGIFTASWANVAVKTSVLRAVKAKWGNYVDPRLRNMEDFLFNARVAALGIEWVWREGTDGFWTAAEKASASAADHQAIINADTALTQQLIGELRG